MNSTLTFFFCLLVAAAASAAAAAASPPAALGLAPLGFFVFPEVLRQYFRRRVVDAYK